LPNPKREKEYYLSLSEGINTIVRENQLMPGQIADIIIPKAFSILVSQKNSEDVVESWVDTIQTCIEALPKDVIISSVTIVNLKRYRDIFADIATGLFQRRNKRIRCLEVDSMQTAGLHIH
jgi:hypothetical protein